MTLGLRSERQQRRLRGRLEVLVSQDAKAWGEYLKWTHSVAGGPLYDATEAVAWKRLKRSLNEHASERRMLVMELGLVEQRVLA